MVASKLRFFSEDSSIKEEFVTDKNGNKFLCFQVGTIKCCSPLDKKFLQEA